MQAVLPELTTLGASLVVLSPQLEAFTGPGAEKQGLGFSILTDPGNRVGAAYGLAFRLPDDLIEVYRKIGVDLPRYNGDESWTLSMPARLVIARDGRVAAVEADPDYTHRPEVGPAVQVVRGLVR